MKKVLGVNGVIGRRASDKVGVCAGMEDDDGETDGGKFSASQLHAELKCRMINAESVEVEMGKVLDIVGGKKVVVGFER